MDPVFTTNSTRWTGGASVWQPTTRGGSANINPSSTRDNTVAVLHNRHMTPADREFVAERLRTAFELHEAGVDMMRQTLRREHPDASDEDLERMVMLWLQERPGAAFGDAEGKPGTWPRDSTDP